MPAARQVIFLPTAETNAQPARDTAVSLLTRERSLVRNQARLSARSGGDIAESYGRALWETNTNPTVGWRWGARRLIVLLGDSVPHDPELNEGIPESAWIKASPFTTDEELLEPAGIGGTLLGPGADLDWQNVLQQLAVASTPLEVVEYSSTYLPYWENWAARTSGQAILASPGQLGDHLVDLVVAGTRGPCPTVQGNAGKMLLVALKCKQALEALRGRCGQRLSKGKKGFRPPTKLVNHLRSAKYLGLAPNGFKSPDAVIARFNRARTAIDLIKSLPHLVKAVLKRDFQRIALDVTAVPGARACAAGLILAVK